MNEKLFYYLIALILVFLSGYAIYSTLQNDPYTELNSQESTIRRKTQQKNSADSQQDSDELYPLEVGGTRISVEIADNSIERAQGLSGRSFLPEDQGMLFIYDQDNVPSFWMYDMNFNLDMIWIRDNIIVEITKYVPAPSQNTSREELDRYYPNTSVDSILEVNAGFSDKHDIQIGDEVILLEKNSETGSTN